MSEDNSELDGSVAIRKIKKLLILHEGAKKINSEGEAQNALDLAFKFMRKHHITMSQVLDAGLDQSGKDEIVIIEKETERYIANALPVWLSNIVLMVEYTCNVYCILRKSQTDRSAKQMIINFIGATDDVNSAVDLYLFFKKVTLKLSNKHQKDVGGKFLVWRSFAEGFTQRLLEKAKTMTGYDRDETENDNGLQEAEEMSDDDLTPISEDEEENEEETEYDDTVPDVSESFEIQLHKNEVEALKRYRNQVEEKIKEFINDMNASEEELKLSAILDKEAYLRGRVAAEDYNITQSKYKQLGN